MDFVKSVSMSNNPKPVHVNIMQADKPILLDNCGLAVDDRGQISFANNIAGFEIKRFYQVQNYQQGFVRAWHGHKFESKLMWVTQGAVLVQIAPFSEETLWLSAPVYRFVLSANQPRLLYIPKGHYNGFKTLTQGTQVVFFSNKTLLESAEDDIRTPWKAHSEVSWDIEQR